MSVSGHLRQETPDSIGSEPAGLRYCGARRNIQRKGRRGGLILASEICERDHAPLLLNLLSELERFTESSSVRTILGVRVLVRGRRDS